MTWLRWLLDTAAGRWIAVIAIFVAALAIAAYLGMRHGIDVERLRWQARMSDADAHAREIERGFAAATAESAARTAARERTWNAKSQDQARRLRAALAEAAACRVPADVGRVLDDVSGAGHFAGLARPSQTDSADTALADELERVRENYAICRVNIERLTEAQRWYGELKRRTEQRK